LHTNLLPNPTADAAHLVLPSASFAEKRGSMVNLAGRLQRLNRALEAPGLARDDWEILRDLIRGLAPDSAAASLASPEEVFRAMAAVVPAFAGLNLANIGDLGLPVLATGYQIPLLAKERERKKAGVIVG